MKVGKKILIAIGVPAIIVGLILRPIIDSCRSCTGGWDGRSVEKILSVPPEKATLADIEKLSKSEVMQLFHAELQHRNSRRPLDGEYH